MCAERALALGQSLHDRGDRDYRSVAGEDGVGAHVRFDFGKQFLLQRQIFRNRLDDVIGLAHRFGKIGAWPHARDRALVLAEVAQVGGDARLRRIEARRDGIRDRHVMTGKRENLRNAVTHEAGTDDGNA